MLQHQSLAIENIFTSPKDIAFQTPEKELHNILWTCHTFNNIKVCSREFGKLLHARLLNSLEGSVTQNNLDIHNFK